MKAIQRIFVLLNKSLKYILIKVITVYSNQKTKIVFYINNISHSTLSTLGVPIVSVSLKGKCVIGSNFNMNSGFKYNPLGRNTFNYLIVEGEGSLSIGNNVGMSNSAIYCTDSIQIGNDVLLGSGVCIYDTDFHPILPNFRNSIELNSNLDEKENTKTEKIIIGNNVFIGAHSTILKGVVIGDNSIVGACSLVTKSIPNNEIWGGNPAKFIRKI